MQGNDSIKYATSILDYVFRELAVSYLERFDLAHVDPTEGGFDALGKGVEEGKPAAATRYVSKGLTRSRTDKLGSWREVRRRRRAGVRGCPRRRSLERDGVRRRTRAARRGRRHHRAQGRARAKLSPAEQLEQHACRSPRAEARALAAERRAEARAKGYEGEACGECGNFTLVRNGTCLKCDTCGGTTGCS